MAGAPLAALEAPCLVVALADLLTREGGRGRVVPPRQPEPGAGCIATPAGSGLDDP